MTRAVFWIVDNGSSHRGLVAVQRLQKQVPTTRSRPWPCSCQLAKPNRNLLFRDPKKSPHSQRFSRPPCRCRAPSKLSISLGNHRSTIPVEFYPSRFSSTSQQNPLRPCCLKNACAYL